MERITVPFETKQTGEDEGVFTFEGMASTFGNVDRQGDIIERGAFTDSLTRLRAKASDQALMPVLFSHDAGMPVGVFTELEETDDGLFAKGELPMADTFVSGRMVPQMKARSIRAMSIGFQISERRFDGELRILEKLDLWEASLVVFPANPQAQITGFKSNRLTSDDIDYLQMREVEDMLRNGMPLSRRLAKEVASKLAAGQRDAGDGQVNQRDADSKDEEGRLLVFGRGFDALNQALKGNHHARSQRDRIQI